MNERSKVSQASIGTLYKIEIDDMIVGVENYREELDVLYDAQENDHVIVYVNTDGGDLNTCITLTNAILGCNAPVTTVLEGKAHSGGGPILLAGDNIIVLPHTGMLIHQAASGTGGKINDSLKYLEYSNRQVAKFYKESYEGFLTESEIESVLHGDDIWLHSEEIIERLEQANALQEALESVSIDDLVESPPDTPPSKPTRRKTSKEAS